MLSLKCLDSYIKINKKEHGYPNWLGLRPRSPFDNIRSELIYIGLVDRFVAILVESNSVVFSLVPHADR